MSVNYRKSKVIRLSRETKSHINKKSIQPIYRRSANIGPEKTTNHMTYAKHDRSTDLLNLFIIEFVVFLFLYFSYEAFIVNRPFIFSDIAIYNVNSPILSQLGAPNPWFNLYAVLAYMSLPRGYGTFWNVMLIFTQMLMPIGMYFLLKYLKFGNVARIGSSIFYVINPFTFSYGFGGEYSIFLIFAPIIVLFMLRYSDTGKFADLIEAGIFSFFLFEINGILEFKYLIFLIIPLAATGLWKRKAKNLVKTLKDYSIAVAFVLLISVPLILSLLQALFMFQASLHVNASIVPGELSIVRYEFQSSNILVAIMALPLVPGDTLTNLGYLSSWYGALYVFLILAGIFSALFYKGSRKSFYNALMLILVSLIAFQYGVYNGSFLFLYKYPLFDIYNYPNFFNIIQLIVYVIFLSQFIEFLEDKAYSIPFGINLKTKQIKDVSAVATVILVLTLVVLSSLPIVQYYHATTPSAISGLTAPPYVDNLTIFLKGYQNSRVLILPNNDTTLSYLDVAIPYSNVYGLPYNYQAFQSEFPSEQSFSKLSIAFARGNVPLITNLITSQNITSIVVLNPSQSQTISSGPTTINGGGKNFARIINQTGAFYVAETTSDYIIYNYNARALATMAGRNVSNSLMPTGFVLYNNTNGTPSVHIVTSNYSSLQIPIRIVIPSDVKANVSVNYDQEIFISRNLSSNINSNFSNICFSYSNDTPIYAWIYNVTPKGATIWIKMNGEFSRTLYLRVFPKTDNRLSANGYLGEAPQLSGLGATGILPSYVIYSTAAVGVYGYGTALRNYTMNFTFDPQQFTSVENKNLSNIAVFSYNGTILQAKLQGNPTNLSTVATLSISFPGGVSYFEKYNGNYLGTNSYNFFYIGFASKSTNLSAIYSSVNYTSSPVMAVGYIPYSVKDFGTFGKYDNGGYVFAGYRNFTQANAFADAWQFAGSIEGYGFYAFTYYAPFASLSYPFFNLSEGQIGETYSKITSFQSISSPAFITNNSNDPLYGNINESQMNIHNAGQSHSLEVGWGTYGASGYVQGIANYNNSKSYISVNETSGFRILGFNLFGAGLLGNSAFLTLNDSEINTSVSFTGITKFGISSVAGGSFTSYFSILLNLPLKNEMPAYSFMKPSVAQAFFGASRIQNPAYVKTSVTFTALVLDESSSLKFDWDINNHTLQGSSVNYTFNRPGSYNVTVKGISGHYTISTMMVEKILGPLTVSIYNTANKSLQPGKHVLSANVTNSTGLTYFYWFINGVRVQNDSPNLTYDFGHSGPYAVTLVVVNSAGYSRSSFVLSIKANDIQSKVEAMYLVYNVFGIPLGLLYLSRREFRKLTYKLSLSIRSVYSKRF